MRFSLQDVKKSVHRRGGELAVSLHFLRPGELHSEIERLIAYYEQLLKLPQREFSLDVAREYVGDYRLAQCLVATLSNWYTWRQRTWMEVIATLQGVPHLEDITSPAQLRLILYNYVNEHYHGFLSMQQRTEALRNFAESYGLGVSDLEYLLIMDSEEEALLQRSTAGAPHAAEVVTLYNQWVFEAALFNASNVSFAIDCDAFAQASAAHETSVKEVGGELQGSDTAEATRIKAGVGTVIKRLCYLARKLGVYYDLAYEPHSVKPLLYLTLYGPQEVTGTSQHYGLRLARLCRMLLGYSAPAGAAQSTQRGARKKSTASLPPAIVKAEATVHFLQRAYAFVMDADVFRLISSIPPMPPTPPLAAPAAQAQWQTEVFAQSGQSAQSSQGMVLFDSGIEQSFAEAFTALATSLGVDGWRLEREPEPLLLDSSILIPDFALTRDQHRIYVEILGFWTPSYRERKIQKLQQLQGRNDLLLAIPCEARDAFASILPAFPAIFYNGQLSATELINLLRERYDDFAERLAQLDTAAVGERVMREGFIAERVCYTLMHCYRRNEVQHAAEHVMGDWGGSISFIPGLGLYHLHWLDQLHTAVISWLGTCDALPLSQVANEMRVRWSSLANSDESTIETLLSLWPEVQIRRDSIFDAVVTVGTQPAELIASTMPLAADKTSKKQVREKRPALKKQSSDEAKQADLWG